MPQKERKNADKKEFEKFKEFTRKLVNVPKKEIDEREKEYQMKKEKAKD